MYSRYYKRDFLLDGTAFALLAILVVGMFVAVGVDSVYGIKAQPAQYACEAKRMDYRRVSFSTTVICVPRSLDTRNDTLTIQR